MNETTTNQIERMRTYVAEVADVYTRIRTLMDTQDPARLAEAESLLEGFTQDMGAEVASDRSKGGEPDYEGRLALIGQHKMISAINRAYD